ncbi:probable LRR receptor-like serine/threonine-protein kinase At1g06840 [Rhododendron vialii]|uniref:probable LRR receptor-like serine/threonine-protein kinase At1g06840 n=1 Tax=Rhododendron vialii TaxID=182163 RepID=UPI0026602935|nr:probable LRR receptor-like serine/threonine-protein kinase At1g06840 [Rhododendron vialii]XP_058195944.1 probable LRR receptor-like serine/threonine-protein kinase At1g06840 [Rhododendron vialii]
MFWSRVWLFGGAFCVCLCWFCLFTGADGQITRPEEVTALRAIKQSLVDPNRNLSNWNRGDPCMSNWTGVLCFNSPLDDGYLHVRELQLLNMNLSGSLSPELGRLSYMIILDFMWNQISGNIPKEIGNITSLELLLLNGNQLTGSLPEEIGYLPNLDRIQIDQNHISGSLPKSFANLNKTKHFHMNNNSISGQIPPELSVLPNLVHFLLDNNNLSGYLPPDLANLPNLLILQLDNNHFDGTSIPASYSNMSHLLKLSLRNCGLLGPIPDLSRIPNLAYIDLSSNQLNGSIPPEKLSENMTTIDLSNNNLTGPIPTNFSSLPLLQILSLANNSLNGSVPSIIWRNRTSSRPERLVVDLQNNIITNINGSSNLPPNVTVRLQGNPICLDTNLVQFCGTQTQYISHIQSSENSNATCPVQACPYEYAPSSPVPCFCAAPLLVGYRLKSPGFTDFRPYKDQFEVYLTNGLVLEIFQLYIDSFIWEEGPRLKMYLKFFPVYIDNASYVFNKSEVLRIRSMFTGWKIPDSDIFGPYELLNFTLWGPYEDVIPFSSKSGISKGALAGIVVGAVAGAVMLSAVVSLIILRLLMRKQQAVSKRRQLSKITIKIDGVKDFTYGELALATNNFDASAQVGQGGYGKVYKGTLADGTVVAIKRAQEGSLQGEKEFLTEIELLSRLHHRNLVSLLGYCDEESEQMLVYEFMPNGTLRDHLSGKTKEPLGLAMRVRIALGSAKGILYLHTEADPPIFHRDIKASNILLDSRLNAKVADFGLSRLAPVPDIEGTTPGHVSTVVKGTPGYLDPEYFLTHKLTDKSDVYSLGVVFLELLTGMHPISHGKNIVREVNSAYQSGMIFSVVDDRMGAYPAECVERFVNLGLKCCQEETDARPSMAEVVRELETIWGMMPEFDTKTTESLSSDPGKVMSPSSSISSEMKNKHTPYVSGDISGSDLVSGVIPTITPR